MAKSQLLNRPPVVADISFTVESGSVLFRPAPGVLANASDPDNDTLGVMNHTDPKHAAASSFINALAPSFWLSPNGSFSYEPAASYVGPDSFTITVSDRNGGLAGATVFIAVTAGALAAFARHCTTSLRAR